MHSQENENSFKVSNFDICFQQMCIFLFECSSLTLKSLTYLFDFNLSKFLIDCGLFNQSRMRQKGPRGDLSVYHLQSITFSASPSVHHPQFITFSASPSVHHRHCITVSASPSVHHPQRITFTVSTSVHLSQCITFSASRSVHHLQCVTFSAPPSVHHLQCITFSASPSVHQHQYFPVCHMGI